MRHQCENMVRFKHFHFTEYLSLCEQPLVQFPLGKLIHCHFIKSILFSFNHIIGRFWGAFGLEIQPIWQHCFSVLHEINV